MEKLATNAYSIASMIQIGIFNEQNFPLVVTASRNMYFFLVAIKMKPPAGITRGDILRIEFCISALKVFIIYTPIPLLKMLYNFSESCNFVNLKLSQIIFLY